MGSKRAWAQWAPALGASGARKAMKVDRTEAAHYPNRLPLDRSTLPDFEDDVLLCRGGGRLGTTRVAVGPLFCLETTDTPATPAIRRVVCDSSCTYLAYESVLLCADRRRDLACGFSMYSSQIGCVAYRFVKAEGRRLAHRPGDAELALFFFLSDFLRELIIEVHQRVLPRWPTQSFLEIRVGSRQVFLRA